MKNKGIIYKAENMENGYVYIGTTTKSIEERKGEHIRKANKGNGHGFQEAITTYGKEAFRWEQIDTANSVNELAHKEKKYIYEYNSKEEGYNSDSGGGFKKTVYKYSLDDGRLIDSFESLGETGATVGATKQGISRACLNVNNIYGGFYWSYELKETFEPKKDKRKKKVLCINLKDGLVREFDSVASASKETRTNKTTIAKYCRGERKPTGSINWQYK